MNLWLARNLKWSTLSPAVTATACRTASADKSSFCRGVDDEYRLLHQLSHLFVSRCRELHSRQLLLAQTEGNVWGCVALYSSGDQSFKACFLLYCQTPPTLVHNYHALVLCLLFGPNPFSACSLWMVTLQGTAKRQAPGLVNFVPVVPHHFWLAFPAELTQVLSFSRALYNHVFLLFGKKAIRYKVKSSHH